MGVSGLVIVFNCRLVQFYTSACKLPTCQHLPAASPALDRLASPDCEYSMIRGKNSYPKSGKNAKVAETRFVKSIKPTKLPT
jgi:hypothetical protein